MPNSLKNYAVEIQFIFSSKILKWVGGEFYSGFEINFYLDISEIKSSFLISFLFLYMPE